MTIIIITIVIVNVDNNNHPYHNHDHSADNSYCYLILLTLVVSPISNSLSPPSWTHPHGVKHPPWCAGEAAELVGWQF